VSDEALNTLIRLLRAPRGHDLRSQFFDFALENLKNGTTVAKSLKLVMKVGETYAPQSMPGENVKVVIEQLDAKFQILTIFFDDYAKYNKEKHAQYDKL
jgi:hypothetical protein